MIKGLKEAVLSEYKPDDKPAWGKISYDSFLLLLLIITLVVLVVV